jgi:hypothetical protein
VWEQQFALAERFHDGASRTETAERFKHKPDALLHRLVGIERDLTLRVIKEANGNRHLQFTAARFAEQDATHTGLHHMQFCFAPGAFQPEQKPIIKVGGIVESVLIEEECR